MTDYEADRRLFHVMKLAGWAYEPKTGGFVRKQDGHTLWVSWGQAESALSLADEGEAAAGVAPMSRTVAAIINRPANVRAANDG
jgi:hypothetical protein